MIFAAILAGGKGTRMKSATLPKQFLPLGDTPMLIYTINKFLSVSQIDKIYIGINPEWKDYALELISTHLSESACAQIEFVDGGKDRNESLFNVVEKIENDFGQTDEDILITHDAVRPFVTAEMIEQNIDVCARHGAVGTVIGATDTVYFSENLRDVSDVPDRENVFLAQTPQTFNIKVLKDAYETLDNADKKSLTDGCKICAKAGVKVKMVQGDVSNFKVTTDTDYLFAQTLVSKSDK
jgi:2-C-methyl-D-erythritol 4-phosphate cytidylyltransferase